MIEELDVLMNPKSRVAEAVKTIRTNLEFSSADSENKKISEGELSSKKDSQRNVNSLVNNSSAFIIDDSVVGMVENLGYKSEYMYKWLNNSELNYATATYFLLAKFNSSNNPSC